MYALPRLVVFASVCLAFLAGCGEPTGVVTGTVTYQGTPVDEGFISFSPVGGKGQTAGGPIKNGVYRIKGLKPGMVKIHVDASKQIDFAKSSPDPDKAPKGKGQSAELLPPGHQGNDVEREITAGEQFIDITLTRPK